MNISALRAHLLDGQVIPAHPLALDENRRLDERRQKALSRYYVAAGAGGMAVGVHTTQFEIRAAQHNLLQPVLELASQTIDEELAAQSRFFVKVAGICGETPQAVAEAELALRCGYHAGLLSLAALADADEETLLNHCRTVAQIIPIIGFYLQPSVGGRVLPYSFWRRFAEIENVVAIKIAPFNRYQTLDVVRAVAESGRADIALYTGNDDTIVADLLTRFQFKAHSGSTQRFSSGLSVFFAEPSLEKQIVGGLLGHWAVWTKRAVELLDEVKGARTQPTLDISWLTRAAQITDSNAAFFDPAHNFAGCIAGIHEVLRRQGLLKNIWCLNPDETLSPGQVEEIDRVYRAYPHLNDDEFVKENLDEWLS